MFRFVCECMCKMGMQTYTKWHLNLIVYYILPIMSCKDMYVINCYWSKKYKYSKIIKFLKDCMLYFDYVRFLWINNT